MSTFLRSAVRLKSCGYTSRGLRCCNAVTSKYFSQRFQVGVQSANPSTCFFARTIGNERCFSTATESDVKNNAIEHVVSDTEKVTGESQKFEFQAETRKLLDIVAKSLYSQKEVFVRELISNSSDALEKLRYLQAQGEDVVDPEKNLEILIATDSDKKTITIQDSGVGLTKDELIENLGTIAHSGSTKFLEEVMGNDPSANKNIIGNFGVGFYSTFMVGDKIDVYTKSYKPSAEAHKWSSDGLGSYEVYQAEDVDRGTKIVIHLKPGNEEFCKEEKIREIIEKYSNFVGIPIFLNGRQINIVEALWMKDIKSVTPEEHEHFYKFISNAFDKPRFWLHYKTDAPLNIRAVLYVPEYKPTLFEMSRETDVGITLYSRKVMIMAKANQLLPKWLRFIKGVVDSEDMPLNLSRELLQDNALVRKINWVLTNRLLKYFSELSKKDEVKYLKFYEDYGLFFREGIVTTPEQEQREEISKLLRFESSELAPGKKTGLDDYAQRMKAGGRIIYYLSAPNRELADNSPYMEASKKLNREVLYCYENYDELVLMNLGQFQGKLLKSIESEFAEDASDGNKNINIDNPDESKLKSEEVEDLCNWLQVTLGNKLQKVKSTSRLANHPCIITVPEMGAARHFLKTTLAEKSEEEKFQILQPTLEINASNPIMKKLSTLKANDPELAKLVAHQVFDNAMIAAGLLDDPRSMLGRMNELLTKALDKH